MGAFDMIAYVKVGFGVLNYKFAVRDSGRIRSRVKIILLLP